jgi:adenylate cyclase class 2
MIEVELKFPLQDPDSLLKSLDHVRQNLSFIAREETDEYFQHPCRDFRVTDEALRIRASGEQVELTWKGPKLDVLTKSRRELELTIGDQSAASEYRRERLREILLALGFSSLGFVHKHRRTAEFSFRGRTIHVSVDEVRGLGLFVELETLCEPPDRESAAALLLQLADVLGLKNSERRSYIMLLSSR